MKDFFKFREELQTNEMYANYKSSPGYNDNDHKQFSHHKGDDKRSVQYRKAEHEVSHKHGADAHAIGHHKGDTAVEHEKSHRDFSGSSSSDHSHHAVVHHDGTHTNISLPNSKKATAAHVTKQSKKVHPNLAADIAHNHNEINFHESVVNEATHLTMVTHDGEEHHVIHGMAHTQANADKVRNATAKAAAKHAGGGATHHDIKDGWDEGVHHEMSNSPHTDKKPATKGAARYGGHGDMKIHKSLDAYVKHHAKADAHYHNQGEDYD